MKLVRQTKPSTTHAVLWCSLLAILYVLLIFLLPANTITQAKYSLGAFEYRMIMLLVAVPSIVVWFAAFVGYGALRSYTRSLGNSKEAADFKRLSDGCTILVWSLPITAIATFLLNAWSNSHTNFHPTAIVVTNYISLILPLIAFTIICLGSHRLLSHIKMQLRLRNMRLMTLIFAAFGIVYCYLTFQHLDLSSFTASNNPYFLPLWLLIITLIIPYLYTWFVGLIGAAQIVLFSHHSAGLLYRRALLYLAVGIVAVIISSIALQYINAVIPRVGHLRLDYRLVLIILFRMVGAAGFICIAIGANRLKRIEEV